MPRSRRTTFASLAVAAALLASAGFPGSPALAGTPAQPKPPATSDVREPDPGFGNDKPLPFATRPVGHQRQMAPLAQTSQATIAAAGSTLGDNKSWLVADEYYGTLDLQDFTLRGLGNHVQVWVADDTAFPDGDCRNDLATTAITNAQVSGLVSEFDTNIYPKESAAFSTPPARDGSDAGDLADYFGLPADYWTVDTSQADDIVVLVSNVRDADYYDPTSPDGHTYVAGFFGSDFNEYLDRNVMTIDAFDWLHRTGANPPDSSADPAYVACSTEIDRTFGAPRPRLYEGTFAHEYQHLLQSYVDGSESVWVDEGLSMWSESLVGYTNTLIAPDKPGAADEIRIFTGFEDPDYGGPENSLTAWSDQGAPEILSDYGAAQAFMVYLAGRFGTAFMSALHKNPGHGLIGLDTVLKARRTGTNAQLVLHDWSAMMALDAVSGAYGPVAPAPGRFKSSALTSKINWNNPQSYDSPGAPPNGSDYVRLRNAGNQYLSAKGLSSLVFDGAKTLVPLPLEWTSVTNPPDDTSTMSCLDPGTGTGAAALYSGCGDSLDRSIVRQVAVPLIGATFTFDALWNTEEGYDYVYPIISADGGKTWTNLTTADTVPEGGFTGDGGTWTSETASLTAYAGKTVQIGFRYVSDPGVSMPGFWVRNLKVGATALPTSLAGWKTTTQTYPPKVSGYTVQVVSYTASGNAWWVKMPVNAQFHGSLTAAQRGALGNGTTVAAIVTFDDPSEGTAQSARYALKANGVLQPGG